MSENQPRHAMAFADTSEARRNDTNGDASSKVHDASVPEQAHFSQAMSSRFRRVRALSESLCESLELEDFVVQSMPDVSPTRWHLAHTTWFFETFILVPNLNGYSSPNPAFQFLFNSYYNQVGEQFPRAKRGLITRPTVSEVFGYRSAVDGALLDLLSSLDFDDPQSENILALVELGLHHEQQHQELMLTDIKHVLSCNPLMPVFRATTEAPSKAVENHQWCENAGGVKSIGHQGTGFAFDNESPRHEVLCQPFSIGSRLVTCGEYLEFIEDGGYTRAELWLSLGWQTVQDNGWSSPLYWHQEGDQWQIFTLGGKRDLNLSEPVCHVSFFEADAFARWREARLPLESEWELSAAGLEPKGNFVESHKLHPVSNDLVGTQSPGESDGAIPQQMFGDVWEWTASPYIAYPGYRPPVGAVGEYNGKFMCNQFVLRGGSCATSHEHIRATYRNFFPPDARWQFTGIRLACDGA